MERAAPVLGEGKEVVFAAAMVGRSPVMKKERMEVDRSALGPRKCRLAP